MDDAMTTLPAFELDCRDWFVSGPVAPGGDGTPADDEDAEGAPVLATLSTLVVSDELREATGSITVGLLDDDDDLSDLEARAVRPGGPAQELLDHEPEPGTRRYIVPAPTRVAADGPRLALLAEFRVPVDAELDRRVDALMGSFRWRAA
ncbi:hypothetical protein [Jatrophihabitans fulvus]